MGQDWDDDVAFQKEFWQLCYSVLKPGAHVVAFSHEKTYHRLASAMEHWFDIRGMFTWTYKTGFPFDEWLREFRPGFIFFPVELSEELNEGFTFCVVLSVFAGSIRALNGVVFIFFWVPSGGSFSISGTMWGIVWVSRHSIVTGKQCRM